jgi:uncharacterized protein
MPQGWSRPHDVDLLADGRQSFDLSIPLSEFPRLREQLAEESGSVHVTADFARELGFPVADVAVQADLTLTCQRCLGPLRWPVDSRTRVVLVPDLASADRAPEGLDPVVVEEGRTSVAELAEEELLLALPLVAMHAIGAVGTECGAVAMEPPVPARSEESNKPFAQLGELLKRN